MYGLINDSIRRLVLQDAGEAVWERIAWRAGSGFTTFAAMHYYDDELTYGLVDAAAAELETPADVLLTRFGHYWSTVIAPESYGDYLDSTGRSLWETLAGLDAMHARLQALFPELRPPSIDVESDADGVITVHYRSDREGLAPFVRGLLQGLIDLYELDAVVTQIGRRNDGADHDIFAIRQ